MASRRRIVSAKIAEDAADLTFDIFGPAGEDGKQPVADTMTYNRTSIPDSLGPYLQMYGLAQIVSNRYNRLDEDATPADVRAAVSEVLDAVTAGTWTPGRVMGEREPTDLELAIAEATGTPISDLLDRIENEVQLDANGQPKLDGRGRKMRVFTQRVLDGLKDDPAVRPIYARLVAERAKRLQAAAKNKGGVSSLGKLFAAPSGEVSPEPEAVAAQ
jgi:hypothetical protein